MLFSVRSRRGHPAAESISGTYFGECLCLLITPLKEFEEDPANPPHSKAKASGFTAQASEGAWCNLANPVTNTCSAVQSSPANKSQRATQPTSSAHTRCRAPKSLCHPCGFLGAGFFSVKGASHFLLSGGRKWSESWLCRHFISR